jgi:cell wall-associated NlpC family hydrolase
MPRAARVVAGVAPVRGRPAADAETVTFYHYGETVRVLADEAPYARCRSEFDGYVGYVEARHLAPGPVPPATHFVGALGAYAYRAADLRLPAAEFLPRHSAVVVGERGILTRGTEYARLDSGLYLPLACLAPEPPRSSDLAAAAALYLGCPYLWGGRSWLGIDCSGLVQAAFRDLGLTVPRDTDQQRDAIGAPVPAADESRLRRGDLVYLPGHVMIHEGGGAVIHADGATMTVRRDNLAALMRLRRLDFAGFTVRRP